MASNGLTNAHSNRVASRDYIRWDAEGVEKIPPNEQEDIQAVAEMINKIQRAQFNSHRHMYSGTHARTQGVVKGNLIVGDLLLHLARSLFSKPAEYPIAMRYSTEPGDPGLGIKILASSRPALDLADAKTTKEIINLCIKYGGDKKELYKHLEARNDTPLQKARDEVRNTHLSSTRQYSQAAYRYGNYVVKYYLVPSSGTQKKQYEETVKSDSHPDDILSEWLKEFHANHDAKYLFQV
ncbi:hypothetical protein G7Y89_g12923 [Cudoniella acicularis]|uniref:Catalase core domain-containing protein n=1 Tax=Cudoniella acicularis TaxID=354080 RepID=A0A8H4VYQ5_9HELO|nr:hypothetical protein G7Y89_g12923 [Cudoniella acicularis]